MIPDAVFVTSNASLFHIPDTIFLQFQYLKDDVDVGFGFLMNYEDSNRELFGQHFLFNSTNNNLKSKKMAEVL